MGGGREARVPFVGRRLPWRAGLAWGGSPWISAGDRGGALRGRERRGRWAWQGGPGRSAKAGSGERERALCGREAPGWLTGGPDWDGASRGVGRCALGGQARAEYGPSGLLGRSGWREGFGPSGEGWAGLFWVWAPFLIPFLSISFLF